MIGMICVVVLVCDIRKAALDRFAIEALLENAAAPTDGYANSSIIRAKRSTV